MSETSPLFVRHRSPTRAPLRLDPWSVRPRRDRLELRRRVRRRLGRQHRFL